MNKLETIQYAKMFLDKMAQGINPLDDTKIPENDIVNQIRISRCLFYVSGILGEVIENHGIIGSQPDPRLPFFLSAQERAAYVPSNEPKTVTQFAKEISECGNLDRYRPLKYNLITDYLVKIGALEVEQIENGKTRKRVTEKGIALGLYEELRQGSYQSYFAVLYSKEAKQFIMEHLDEVLGVQK